MRRETDARWMAEALRLAGLGEGLTRPNPPVGAVVVRGGKVVGHGYHRRAGGPHAEVYALRQAGRLAKGATLYVTLEPCSTWGRTPPCTDAIIASGVKRVVAAVRDPNPRHAGRGFRLLRRAGIAVEVGVRGREANELIAPFASCLLLNRPFVTVKLAVSVDGRIADATGRSKWISGEASRREVQAMRRRSDAVMVGAGTVLADDPSLLPRPAKGRKPFRVVVDSRGHVSPKASVFRNQAAGRTIVATTRRCAAVRCVGYEEAGGTVWTLPGVAGGVSLAALMRRLAGAGVMRVLVEGGGALAEALFKAECVDELVLFVAPRILGGRGVSSIGGGGWLLPRAPRLHMMEMRRVDCDLLVRYGAKG